MFQLCPHANFPQSNGLALIPIPVAADDLFIVSSSSNHTRGPRSPTGMDLLLLTDNLEGAIGVYRALL